MIKNLIRLYKLLLPAVLLLVACWPHKSYAPPVPSIESVILATPFMVGHSISAKIEHERKKKAWFKEQHALLKQKDIKASANCVFVAYYPDNELQLTKQQQDECIQTVITAWGHRPENAEQTMAIIHIYTLLAEQVKEQNNAQQAMQYSLKALSYLRDKTLPRYEQYDKYERAQMYHDYYRFEFKDAFDRTGFHHLTSDVQTLLDGLKKLEEDDKGRRCIYPVAVKHYLSDTDEDEKRLLSNGCNAGRTILEIRKWKIVWQ